MPQIHLSYADLARLHVAAEPAIDLELTYSLRVARERAPRGFDGWKKQLTGRVDPRVRALFELVPLTGPIPVLFAPGDASANGLSDVVATYHRVAIAPYWPRICAVVKADRGLRGRVAVDGGPEQMLRTLHPAIRWCPPILRVGGDAEDVRLDGRGLLLQPSVFVWRMPVYLHHQTEQPVLVYPAIPELSGYGEVDDLGSLIGRTRAAMLDALAGCGGTTSDLARHAELSLAAASQHAAVLRLAGLISTQRMGRYRFHTLTPLGMALLQR